MLSFKTSSKLYCSKISFNRTKNEFPDNQTSIIYPPNIIEEEETNLTDYLIQLNLKSIRIPFDAFADYNWMKSDTTQRYYKRIWNKMMRF